MSFNTNLDGRNGDSWELYPSTRQSVSLLTKIYPIDVTLTTPGTAQSLYTVNPGIATVNLVTNPSAETGTPPTGYTAVRSATLAQDGTYYNYGSYSLKATPPNVARGEGSYWNLGSIQHDTPVGISAYLRRGAAGADDARVELVANSIVGYSQYTDVRIGVGNTITLSGSWQRSTYFSPINRQITIFKISGADGTFVEDETITGATSGATGIIRTVGTGWLSGNISSATQFNPEQNKFSTETITGGTSGVTATLEEINKITVDGVLHLYIVTATQHGTAFYTDGIQAEVNNSVTDYCDGSQGIFNKWDGAANASTSRRYRKISEIRSMTLHFSRDTYMAADRDANNTSSNLEDRGRLYFAGQDYWTDNSIYLNNKLSFINVNSGEQPRITGEIWGV